ESFRPPVSGASRRSRSESAVAGPGDGRASADAVHGARGIFGGICLCSVCANQRKAGRDVGALVAFVDDRSLDVAYLRYRAGQFLGLLRVGLGWLVVLGPG